MVKSKFGLNVVLYEWAVSQKCLDCTHGCGVIFTNDNEHSNSAICMIGFPNNDGVDCEMYQEDVDD